MNTFEAFTRQFFINPSRSHSFLAPRIKWFGRKGFIDLGSNVTAELAVVERGYGDRFVAINVAIVHKTNGKVTSLDFPFSDMDPRQMTPDSAKHPNVSGVANFYAWHNGGKLAWYIREPQQSEVSALGNKVLEFITLYTPEGA